MQLVPCGEGCQSLLGCRQRPKGFRACALTGMQCTAAQQLLLQQAMLTLARASRQPRRCQGTLPWLQKHPFAVKEELLRRRRGWLLVHAGLSRRRHAAGTVLRGLPDVNKLQAGPDGCAAGPARMQGSPALLLLQAMLTLAHASSRPSPCRVLACMVAEASLLQPGKGARTEGGGQVLARAGVGRRAAHRPDGCQRSVPLSLPWP